jgi:hypothetical protein
MPMPKYRCVRDACGWQGNEPDWEEADEDTSLGIPICPRCEGEVEEHLHPYDAQATLAVYEVAQNPIEERRQALLDYLNSTITWRADHRVEIGQEESSLRVVLAELAADTALVPASCCDDLGLRFGMTYGQLVAWIKDQLV